MTPIQTIADLTAVVFLLLACGILTWWVVVLSMRVGALSKTAEVYQLEVTGSLSTFGANHHKLRERVRRLERANLFDEDIPEPVRLPTGVALHGLLGDEDMG